MTCLDCHSNFHTNGAFHLTPDVRPQAARFRLETTSLRGMFNQQIHGSKRSLRSVEDFTEFEQRTSRALERGFGRWFAWSAFAPASRLAEQRRTAASRLGWPRSA